MFVLQRDCTLVLTVRHEKDIINAKANRLEKDTKVIDTFQLPDWREVILPNEFDINCTYFKSVNFTSKCILLHKPSLDKSRESRD